MPSFNRVLLMGNLTRDPEVRQVGTSATKTCRFALAVSERRRDKAGNLIDVPLFIEVDVWEKLAETCAQYLRKGHPVFVEGRLQMDAWERDGQKFQKLRVRATAVKFLQQAQPDQASRPAGAAEGCDECPIQAP